MRRLPVVLMAAALAAGASAQSTVDGFYLEDAVDAAFHLPVGAAFGPGGRMFVLEKRGVVWVVQDGVLAPEPFVDLRDEVLNHHDRGLLGIAVDPDFETTRRVVLSYTVDPAFEEGGPRDESRRDAFARVTSYAGSVGDPGVADPSSRRVLLGATRETGIPSCYYSHTIGSLAFGADGTLIVGAGDGADYTRADAGGLYPECFGEGRLPASEDIGSFRSQRVESLAGKLLRIDPETGRGLPSNPFYTGDPDDAASKVWALGLRNPYRFSLDPLGGSADPAEGRPGPVYVGDVGWNAYEDLHVALGGENFGWPCIEGPEPNAAYQAAEPATNGCGEPMTGSLTGPDFTWHHNDPTRSSPAGRRAASIVGGAVYRGERYPEVYRGRYFFGDYARGWAGTVATEPGGGFVGEPGFADGVGVLVAYVYDPFSEYLYVVDIVAGRVRRVRHVNEVPNAQPVAEATASPASGGLEDTAGGLRVQFSPAESFDPDGDALHYEWAFGDGAGATDRAPVHTYTEAGTYDATLTVRDGLHAVTAVTRVTVRPGRSPRVRIVSPTAVTRGAAGETVQLRVEVSDPDQPADELFVRWSVVQVHDDHVHPDVFVAADAEAAFVVPEHGGAGEHVYYRVRADVLDREGLTATAETALFLPGDVGEADLSLRGAPIASGLAPGSAPLGVLTDGVMPGPSGRPETSARLVADENRTVWVGMAFPGAHRFSRVTVQEGDASLAGGGFEAAPRVEVRRDGVWRAASGLESAPAYRADDGHPFDTYELSFSPLEGDAVRVVGRASPEGGSVPVAELRVWAVGETAAGPVGAPWVSGDLGGPPASGAARQEVDALTVTGGGQTWGAADAFHYVRQPLVGDGSILARVDAVSASPDWAKAGLMLRLSEAPEAPQLSLAVSNLGVHVQGRPEAGGPTLSLADALGIAPPVWLRLDRVGGTVTALYSTTGADWTVLGVLETGVQASALAGLFASADDAAGAGALVTARFDRVLFDGVPVSELVTETESGLRPSVLSAGTAYPNPAAARVRLPVHAPRGATLRLVDLLGRTLRRQEVDAATAHVDVDLAGLPAGAYLLRLDDGSGAAVSRPLVVAR